MISKRLPKWIDPVNILVGMVLVVIIFEGFSITVANLHTAQNQAQINNAILQEERSQNETKLRGLAATQERQFQIELSQDIKSLLQQQGNLTQADRQTAEDNINRLIPSIENSTKEILSTLQARQNEHEHQTELLIEGLRQTGNATAQKVAIQVIENNSRGIEQIKAALNITE